MKILSGFAALCVLLPSPARSHEIPVNTVDGLIKNCTLDDQSQEEVEFHTGLCLGYIKGVSNYMLSETGGAKKYCVPKVLENGDLIEAVVSLGRFTQKDMGNAPSLFLVQIALERMFHCPKDGG